MLLRVEIHRKGEACPFANADLQLEIDAGECLWLRGPSGAGKSSIALHLVGLRPLSGATLAMQWEGVPEELQSVGMVFQQGVLIDSLNVGENVGLALRRAGTHPTRERIDRALANVGLDPGEASKMPGELSGGMLRRASLAQVLAQGKPVIVLDEPFVGLDEASARGIVALIEDLKQRGRSFILISHEAQYSEPLATAGREVDLVAAPVAAPQNRAHRASHYGFGMRTALRLFDYLVISAPLICFAFVAAGIAISMLFSELLQATNIDALRSQIIGSDPPWYEKMLGIELFQKFVGYEFDRIASEHLPAIRRRIYAMGVSRGFVMELGPLLTALLLAGRIGGSYAGEVGMMQATNQNQLLTTLGVSPRRWTLAPAAIAALVAAPILTAIGVATSLLMAEWVALSDSASLFSNSGEFWHALGPKVFTYDSLLTFPPFVCFTHSLIFMVVILAVAEFVGRMRPNLPPRGVPQSITWAVVAASLLVIVADWGLSQWQLYLTPLQNPLG